MATAPTFKGVTTIEWGVDSFAVGLDDADLIQQSGEVDKAAGEMKKFKDTLGGTVSLAFFDETHESTNEFLTKSADTPARGTAVSIDGEYPHFVQDCRLVCVNDDARRIRVSTINCSGITTG